MQGLFLENQGPGVARREWAGLVAWERSAGREGVGVSPEGLGHFHWAGPWGQGLC